VKKFSLLFFFSLFGNYFLFSQTFGEETNSVIESQLKEVGISQEFRDSQKGILISLGYGRQIISPDYLISSSSKQSFGIRISYTKENKLPFGFFLGGGKTHLFHVTSHNNHYWYPSTGPYTNSNVTYVDPFLTVLKTFLDLGISKNINTKSTLQIGCRFILKTPPKRVDYPIYYEDKYALTFSYLYRMKKLFLGFGVDLYLPYYKEITLSPNSSRIRAQAGYIGSFSIGYNF